MSGKAPYGVSPESGKLPLGSLLEPVECQRMVNNHPTTQSTKQRKSQSTGDRVKELRGDDASRGQTAN
jgi:hypothetical protein